MSKSPSLRRIQADVRELALDPSDQYYAAPLESDLFEWHFTIKGAKGTDFEGGFYHGRILLPAEYPFKAPHIVFLTPSGRFEVNTKICLSFTAFHNELWQPAWGIRLILEALISFLPTKGDGAIGALDWKPEERRRLAKKSVDYACPICGNCSLIMKNLTERMDQTNKSKGGDVNQNGTDSKFRNEIEKLHALQIAAERVREDTENSSDVRDSQNNQPFTSDGGLVSLSESSQDQSDGNQVSVKIELSANEAAYSKEDEIFSGSTSSKQPKTNEDNISDEPFHTPDALEQENGDLFVPFNDILRDATNLISDSTANAIVSALVVVIATLLWGIVNILTDLKKLEEEFRNT